METCSILWVLTRQDIGPPLTRDELYVLIWNKWPIRKLKTNLTCDTSGSVILQICRTLVPGKEVQQSMQKKS